ncbi:hypothetical protein BH09ACT5_BH09ACT5_13070 [soil metagenome]
MPVNSFQKRFTAPVALLIALAMTPALSGCFGNPVEQIVEGATCGNVDLPGQSVPDDFPSDVPLVDGDVVFGMGVGSDDAKAWNVTVKVSGVEVADTIKGQLEDAGFTANESGIGGTTADGATLVYDNGTYNVLVVISKDGQNGFVANYTVTEKS